MTARIRRLFSDIGDSFWPIPGLMVLGGILGAIASIEIERRGLVPRWLLEGRWLYGGGATGARTLLGALATSTIGVAGTVFTITIAALSLAANQMGPRLLRNFTRDRGNQVTLGVFLGTFSYALVVLRSVRTPDEGDFVPHLALSIGLLLALASVGTLAYFVGHVAGRINVDVVIDLVTEDVRSAIKRLTLKAPPPQPPAHESWRGATPITDSRSGYLRELDSDGLADWADEHNTAIRLLVRPGDYVFPGVPIAVLASPVEGAEAAVRHATALGSQRVSSVDLEYAVRKLVEVAVRALSPGINDPNTAINVLDRLGATLCELVPFYLPTGVSLRSGRPVLVIPSVTYEGLTDAMFHEIRQNAAGKPAVLIRLIEVLTAVASCERESRRRTSLKRHADMVLIDAERSVPNSADIGDLRQRHATFTAAYASAPPD